jgi:hypothetical protein
VLKAAKPAARGLRRLGVDKSGLDPDAVEAAALKEAGASGSAAAGVSDLAGFGSDSYREPLEVYLRACEEEAELTTFGRFLINKMLSRSLANRIALHRWADEHPDVRDEQIDSPWIIVGLPRTGTSILSILLGLDPVARPLLRSEAAHPVPPPMLLDAGEDPGIAETAKQLDGLRKLNPALYAMHPSARPSPRSAWPSSCTTCARSGSRPKPTCPPTPAGSSRATWRPRTRSTAWPCRRCTPARPPSAGS